MMRVYCTTGKDGPTPRPVVHHGEALTKTTDAGPARSSGNNDATVPPKESDVIVTLTKAEAEAVA